MNKVVPPVEPIEQKEHQGEERPDEDNANRSSLGRGKELFSDHF